MKIGTSLSRCVRDIFDGAVKFEEVLVIIARTDVDPEDDSQWADLWKGYGGDGIGSVWSNPEWISHRAHEQEFRDICVKLKKTGKLHQPRRYGAHPTRLNEYWYDVILTNQVVDSNPSAKRAWENYKLIAGLS
jgi:hypothetical protein